MLFERTYQPIEIEPTQGEHVVPARHFHTDHPDHPIHIQNEPRPSSPAGDVFRPVPQLARFLAMSSFDPGEPIGSRPTVCPLRHHPPSHHRTAPGQSGVASTGTPSALR